MWASVYSLAQDPQNGRVWHVGKQESLIVQRVSRAYLVLAGKKSKVIERLISGRIIKVCVCVSVYETAAPVGGLQEKCLQENKTILSKNIYLRIKKGTLFFVNRKNMKTI